MVSRVVRKENSGIIFGAYSVFGTLGTMTINKLGGYLYDDQGRIWPFIMTLIGFSVLALLTIVLKIANKI